MLKNSFFMIVVLLISLFHSLSYAASNKLSDVAERAYIYAYPLVLMGITKDVMTDTRSAPAQAGMIKAAVNTFSLSTEFPSADFKDVIRPNVDTLYSSAWLDLSKEPMVLSVPDSGGRYYLLPMLDSWTDIFASPGKRTTGTKKTDFLIAGPFWKGKAPTGMKIIHSPTNMVWIIGRTQTNGREDYPPVIAFEKQLKLLPLSVWGKSDYQVEPTINNAKVDTKTPPPLQVANMDALTFFGKFSELLKENPPHRTDGKMIADLKKMGITPGKSFDATQLTPDQIKQLNQAAKAALSKISDLRNMQGKSINHWKMPGNPIGTYGDNYLTRATVAMYGLGANLVQDAIYPNTDSDSKGNTLNGSHQYRLHFTKNGIPPINAFWSLTMYDMQGYFVKNALNRYSLGSLHKLQYNKDGSLDIFIQSNSPGADKESNWLTAPKGDFNLVLRCYWPKPAVIQETWLPPAVELINS